MNALKEVFIALIPVLQSLVWGGLIAWLVFYFRRDIQLLRSELERRIKAGAQLELGPLKLEKIEQRIASAEKNINITKQFLMSMSEPMYFNLKKLADGQFGDYHMEPGSGLQRELYHLRDIGYIEVKSIRNIPVSGTKLGNHVTVTPIGKKFVELREAYLAKLQALAVE